MARARATTSLVVTATATATTAPHPPPAREVRRDHFPSDDLEDEAVEAQRDEREGGLREVEHRRQEHGDDDRRRVYQAEAEVLLDEKVVVYVREFPYDNTEEDN